MTLSEYQPAYGTSAKISRSGSKIASNIVNPISRNWETPSIRRSSTRTANSSAANGRRALLTTRVSRSFRPAVWDTLWQAAGFVRIQNVLDQELRVSLVQYGEEITVTTLDLNADNHVNVDLALSENIESVTIVISGTTGYTRQPAGYKIQVVSPGE